MKAVKFDKNHPKDFVTDLRKEVEEYFKKNNISRYGNLNMALKTNSNVSTFLWLTCNYCIWNCRNFLVVLVFMADYGYWSCWYRNVYNA